MTTESDIEEQLDVAQKVHALAARRLVDALEALVAFHVHEAIPAAERLAVQGEYNENGFVVRAQQFFDTAGRVLAGWDGDGDYVGTVDQEVWDDLTDLVDPYLDWIGDLTGEDYLGDHEIDLATAQLEHEHEAPSDEITRKFELVYGGLSKK